MNIKTFICFIILTIFVLFIAVKFIIPINKSSKELELTYKISAGIPFKWQYEIEDPDVVSFVKSYVVRNENKGAIVGAPIYTKYVFKGLKKGETTITFKIVSITDGTVSNEEKHKVKVDENNNISLITNTEN